MERVAALRAMVMQLGGPTAAARRLGVSRTTVTYWLNGQRRPGRRAWARLEAALPGVLGAGWHG